MPSEASSAAGFTMAGKWRQTRGCFTTATAQSGTRDALGAQVRVDEVLAVAEAEGERAGAGHGQAEQLDRGRGQRLLRALPAEPFAEVEDGVEAAVAEAWPARPRDRPRTPGPRPPGRGPGARRAPRPGHPGAEASRCSCVSATASAMTATRWRRAPRLEDEPMASRPGSQHAQDHLRVVEPGHARRPWAGRSSWPDRGGCRGAG